ncbi:MAG: HEPN domain-containing protein [Planctomycetes bacterium]|nr:HEPN domain-containing protein [Planctomycetota bacterium]MBM4078467.1 HEPN domain-containing protein [Planctomycetota bacterium]MBM4084836.1 HEPN domain-containing protein [Planctomycetota bacterium]
MKSKADLVRGWLRKAQSDVTNVNLCVSTGQALDTACFHAQQAAEKCLKAYLTYREIDFPFIHNLEKLIEVCATCDPAFQSIKPLAELLTPYAVELRYDADFWPDIHTAGEAMRIALKIRGFVLERLPAEFRNGDA